MTACGAVGTGEVLKNVFIKLSIIFVLGVMSRYANAAMTMECLDFETGQSYPCSTTCTKFPSWANYSTGYQRGTYEELNCRLCYCETKYSYRCASGYYGTTSNGTSGCTACPSGGTSVAGSNSSITGCYVPASTELTDSTGTFSHTTSCYYTN